MARFAALLLSVLFALPAAGESWKPETVGILAGQERIFRDDQTGSLKVRAKGRYFRLAASEQGLTLLPTSGPAPVRRPEDAIPHSKITGGSNDIAMAWLADGTERYAHGVLGDDIEAAALRIRTSEGRDVRLALREEFVFEDLIPRLVDIDDDGSDEILIVRSHRDAGAALVLLGLRGNRLVRISESPAIGVPNRWVNPIAVADFDGDGAKEVAAVETPHIGGKLLLLEIEGRRLREVARYTGYSTHILGSTELEMFAVFDVNGDGVKDIVLPTQDRRELRAVSFAKGRLIVLATAKLFRPVTSALITEDLDRDGRLDLVFGDAGGYVNVIRR